MTITWSKRQVLECLNRLIARVICVWSLTVYKLYELYNMVKNRVRLCFTCYPRYIINYWLGFWKIGENKTQLVLVNTISKFIFKHVHNFKKYVIWVNFHTWLSQERYIGVIQKGTVFSLQCMSFNKLCFSFQVILDAIETAVIITIEPMAWAARLYFSK